MSLAKGKASLTGEEIAEILSVTPATIRSWVRRGCPVAERGQRGNKKRPSRYDEKAVREWIEKTKRKKFDLEQARARKDQAQAIFAEQTVAIRAGDLVPRVQVERAWAAEVSAVRAKLLAWPSTISDRLYRESAVKGVKGVERVIKEAVEGLLRELSEPKRAKNITRAKKPRGSGRRKK